MLANRLSDATLLSTELFEVFHNILKSNHHISQASLADIAAVRERVSVPAGWGGGARTLLPSWLSSCLPVHLDSAGVD